ncbi:hypothetical protein [Pseudomonas alabamensis]|uniref:hypothetical protein n=1 Tax=Pseudomonas alabamensis TaxID=3064349 RepID=UPI003F64E39A
MPVDSLPGEKEYAKALSKKMTTSLTPAMLSEATPDTVRGAFPEDRSMNLGMSSVFSCGGVVSGVERVSVMLVLTPNLASSLGV